jgi:L-lactate dehydrogenase (cytochrome)
MGGLQAALTIDDLKTLAKRRVPKMFFDYVESGSWTEQTFRDNERDFAKFRLRQRIAVNMDNRSLVTSMIGQPIALLLGNRPRPIR